MYLCLRCKGKLLCGRKRCIFLSYSPRVEELEATPPSIFVGRIGYPKVFVGPILSPGENPELFDSPKRWSGRIEDVVSLRMRVARGMKLVNVNAKDRFISELQMAVASVRHVDIDAKFDGVIKKPYLDAVVKPAGLSVRIEDFRLESNPKIPAKVDKIYYDDVRAEESIYYLFRRGFDDYYIQKLFSAGMLGEQKRRKLVPTRWSITAVHDIIAEKLKREVVELKTLSDFLLYRYEHFGNRFSVLLCPDSYSFKLVEVWRKGAVWCKREWIGYDEETARKKREYSPLSGGYYAARLPVLEYMVKRKFQAKAIVLREITPEYTLPLGVWVVEEGVRRALSEKPERFESFDEAINAMPAINLSILRTKQATLSEFG